VADDYDIVDSGHRYVLGAGDDYYGIWDKLGTREPLHRFPGTDEGLTQAEERFWELSRADVKARDVWSTRLRWALFIALGVWVLFGGLYGLLGLSSEVPGYPAFTNDGIAKASEIALIIQDLAFRAWLASAVALAVLWLKHRGPASASRGSLPPR
jgi:hypothetical protein